MITSKIVLFTRNYPLLVFAARTAQSFILIFYVSGQTFLSKMSDCKISHFLLSSSCKSSKAVRCIVVQADQLKKSAAFMLSVPIPPYSSLFNPAITLDSSNWDRNVLIQTLKFIPRLSWYNHLTLHVSLSSPRAKRAGPKGLRAESARAVTGRRCPHSGVG